MSNEETIAKLEQWIKATEGSLKSASRQYAKDGLGEARRSMIEDKAHIDAMRLAIELLAKD